MTGAASSTPALAALSCPWSFKMLLHKDGLVTKHLQLEAFQCISYHFISFHIISWLICLPRRFQGLLSLHEGLVQGPALRTELLSRATPARPAQSSALASEALEVPLTVDLSLLQTELSTFQRLLDPEEGGCGLSQRLRNCLVILILTRDSVAPLTPA